MEPADRSSGGALRRRGFVGLTLAARAEPGGAGLAIRGVAEGSDAAEAGVEAGDVLLSLDQNPATDLGEVRQLLRGLRAGDPLSIEVRRGNQRLTLETRVREFPLEAHAGARTLLGEVSHGAFRLRSLAVLPDTAPPYPVVYYLPGAHWASEEYPRDLEHPVPALASAFARIGVGTLRVERCGTGDSEGPPCTRVDFDTELAGYRAGLEWLLEQEWCDRTRVALFGHSLGAMVAPLLAERLRVAAIATFGASAIPISAGLAGALTRHAALDPRRNSASDERTRLVCELIRLVAAGETPAEVFAKRPDLAAVAPSHFRADEAYHRVAGFYHQLEQKDLLGAWGKVACPVLALHGELDYISALEDSLAVARAAGEGARAEQLAGVDHQMSDGGSRVRLAPGVRTALLEWAETWCR